MKPFCLFILLISFCFVAEAKVQPAYFAAASPVSFEKTVSSQKGKAVELDANSIAVNAHAPCRNFSDGKFSSGLSFAKTIALTSFGNYEIGDRFCNKAYLQHIYPTHAIW